MTAEYKEALAQVGAARKAMQSSINEV